MTKKESIGIVIVTFNGEKWIKKTLQSISSECHELIVVVVDNNSEDNTVLIIEQNFPYVHLIKSPQNVGFGKANNLAIQFLLESTTFIFLLNQDTWFIDESLDAMVSCLLQQPNFAIISPLHWDKTGQNLDFSFSKYVKVATPNTLSNDIKTKNYVVDIYEVPFVNAAAWLLPTFILKKIGGFDPIFPHYGEDNDFVHRVHFHGYKVGIFPKSNIIHDRPPLPTIATPINTEKYRKAVFIKYLNEYKNISSLFIWAILKNYVIIIGKSLVRLLKGRFWEAKLYFYLALKITTLLPEIYQNRELCKKLQPNFLV